MDQILFSTFHKSSYWIQYEECLLKCAEKDLCHEVYFLSLKWYPLLHVLYCAIEDGKLILKENTPKHHRLFQILKKV